jgi:hypothetical protein
MRSALILMILLLGSALVQATTPIKEVVVDRKNANALGFLAFLDPSGQRSMFRVVGPTRLKGNCAVWRTSLELFDSRGEPVLSQEADIGPPEEEVVVRGWFTPAANTLEIRLSYSCPAPRSAESATYIFRSRDWLRPSVGSR